MQFQVQGHNYVLHFDRDEGRWFLFEPTLRGFRCTAVVNDDAQPGEFRYIFAQDEDEDQVVN